MSFAVTVLAGFAIAGCGGGSGGATHSALTGRSHTSTSPPPSRAQGWVRHTVTGGVSINTPAAWHFNRDPVPAVAGPSILFAVGTGPVPSGGSCGPTAALKALPADGAFFAAIEYGGSMSEPYTFPSRPKRFDLGPLLGPPECWGVGDHLILFEDGGRYFQVQVVFGHDAPASVRHEVLRSLDSLQVDPLPASQQPAAKCRAGQWTACPEAAWVYEVISQAHVFHLGHRGNIAILGLAHKRSFALWTTPSRPGNPRGASCRRVAGSRSCRLGDRIYVPMRGVRLWIEPASSPYRSLRTKAALPDSATLDRLIRAAHRVRLVTASGAKGQPTHHGATVRSRQQTAGPRARKGRAPEVAFGRSAAADVSSAGLRTCPAPSPETSGAVGGDWHAQVERIGCRPVGRFISRRVLGAGGREGLQYQLSTTRDQHVRLGEVMCGLHPQPAGWRVGCVRGPARFIFLLRP